MQSGLSPAVTPHSRQMGDICSLEILLHYCHWGTSLNVCFPAPVLMRTCLLKWWSAWHETFTLRHALNDHTCVMAAKPTARYAASSAQNKVKSRLLDWSGFGNKTKNNSFLIFAKWEWSCSWFRVLILLKINCMSRKAEACSHLSPGVKTFEFTSELASRGFISTLWR